MLVDPAVRMREDMEALSAAVERHSGRLLAVVFTHSHGDHLADMSLLRGKRSMYLSGEVSTLQKACPAIEFYAMATSFELGSQTWEVLVTLGHHPGHVCLLSEAGLVAGDMLAGIGTILIPPGTGDMNAYIAQLNRLAERKPHLVFPSHGPVVAMPDRLIQDYIDHREKRHQLVLEAVEGGLRELAEIARQAYC